MAWIAQHQRDVGDLDTSLIRRLAVLKIWVDSNGVVGGKAHWKPGHKPCEFDPAYWLRTRDASEFDLEDIGALAIPTPSAAYLADVVRTRYGFLADLDEDELELAAASEKDRRLALRLLERLPGGRLVDIGIY